MKNESIVQFFINKENNVVEALKKIDANAKGLLFVVDDKYRLQGVITDGDIRRWLIKTGNLQGKVSEFVNIEPKVIYKKDIATAKTLMERYDITALPVLTIKGVVSDIIFRKEIDGTVSGEQGLDTVPVVIMAGGKGTRLYPYTKILPKPLIPIGDVPIVERIIDRFCEFGATDFFLTVNYRKEMIKSYFAEANKLCKLSYVEEDKPLGTAGSIKLIEERWDKPFFVTNCDILIKADYQDIYKYHQNSENELTVVSAIKNIVVPYGVINANKNGMVDSMEEKPSLSYLVNTGMYVLNQSLIDEIPEDTFFHMTDLINKLLAEGRKVGMYPISEDSFLDMGEFEEMHRMEQKLNLKTD